MITRREFVSGMALASAAGAWGYTRELLAAEAAPETTHIRLNKTPSACIAPQYVAEDLLRAEITRVDYIDTGAGGLPTARGCGNRIFPTHRLEGGDHEQPPTVFMRDDAHTQMIALRTIFRWPLATSTFNPARCAERHCFLAEKANSLSFWTSKDGWCPDG
jgi:hypothetical protein